LKGAAKDEIVMPSKSNDKINAVDVDTTDTGTLPKRQPAPVTARKPRLTSEPKGVGRKKR
jgi:hypothetical protein